MSKREPGFYIVDHKHGDICLRGPYEHDETAAAVRREMEMARNDYAGNSRNLWIVDNEFLDKMESKETGE